jgi:hypothetical protein
VRRLAPALALVAIALGGCVTTPAPFLPATWVSRPADLLPVAAAPGQGRLQVLIAYGGMMSSHSAVRLETADRRVVFWDPAGDYGRSYLDLDPRWGTFPVDLPRPRDLLLPDPPDLETYLRFRWAMEDTGVEVFEWDLDAGAAETLREVLLNGTNGTHPAGRFTTLSWPAFCAVSVSDFLGRFAAPAVRLEGRHFFPHNLARELYGQAPSRVRIFRPDEAPRVYEATPLRSRM